MIDEKSIIEQYGSGLTIKEISKIHKRMPGTISKILHKNNVNIRSIKEYCKAYENINDIIKEFNGGASVSKLANKYNYTITGMSNLLKSHGCLVLPQSAINKSDWTFVEQRNNLFFYWLGWMISDGNVSPRIKYGRKAGIESYICTHKNDLHILEFFKSKIYPTKSIHFCKTDNTCKLYLNIPRNIYEILLTYGLIPNKTYDFDVTPKLNDLNRNDFFQFYVGFIEGDGSIDNKKMRSRNHCYDMFRIRFSSGSINLTNWIINKLESFGYKRRKIYCRSENNYEYSISGKDAITLGKECLSTQYHMLNRKWDKITLFL